MRRPEVPARRSLKQAFQIDDIFRLDVVEVVSVCSVQKVAADLYKSDQPSIEIDVVKKHLWVVQDHCGPLDPLPDVRFARIHATTREANCSVA
jgi:hypothetical protein